MLGCSRADCSEVAVKEGAMGFAFPCVGKGSGPLSGFGRQAEATCAGVPSKFVCEYESENLL